MSRMDSLQLHQREEGYPECSGTTAGDNEVKGATASDAESADVKEKREVAHGKVGSPDVDWEEGEIPRSECGSVEQQRQSKGDDEDQEDKETSNKST